MTSQPDVGHRPLRLLAGHQIWDRITPLLRSRDDVFAALAHIGSNADTLLPLRAGATIITDASEANIREGSTDPEVLLQWVQRGVKVFSLPGLNAKVILAEGSPAIALIGSADPSWSSEHTFFEASIVTDDVETVAEVRATLVSWLNQTNPRAPVTESWLEEAMDFYGADLLGEPEPTVITAPVPAAPVIAHVSSPEAPTPARPVSSPGFPVPPVPAPVTPNPTASASTASASAASVSTGSVSAASVSTASAASASSVNSVVSQAIPGSQAPAGKVAAAASSVANCPASSGDAADPTKAAVQAVAAISPDPGIDAPGKNDPTASPGHPETTRAESDDVESDAAESSAVEPKAVEPRAEQTVGAEPLPPFEYTWKRPAGIFLSPMDSAGVPSAGAMEILEELHEEEGLPFDVDERGHSRGDRDFSLELFWWDESRDFNEKWKFPKGRFVVPLQTMGRRMGVTAKASPPGLVRHCYTDHSANPPRTYYFVLVRNSRIKNVTFKDVQQNFAAIGAKPEFDSCFWVQAKIDALLNLWPDIQYDD